MNCSNVEINGPRSNSNTRFLLAASEGDQADLSQKLAAALDAAGVPVDKGDGKEAPIVQSEGEHQPITSAFMLSSFFCLSWTKRVL